MLFHDAVGDDIRAAELEGDDNKGFFLRVLLMERHSDPRGVNIPFLLSADDEIVPFEALRRNLNRVALDAQKVEAEFFDGVGKEHIIAVVAVVIVFKVIN